MTSLIASIIDHAHERGLPFMVVGGHAVILSGIPRFTRDVDILIPDFSLEGWSDTFLSMGYRRIHLVHAFAQFRHPDTIANAPVDIMLVDASTWDKLFASSIRKQLPDNHEVIIPSPVHLIAMKLHAVSSPHRRAGNSDWSDILGLIKTHDISLDDESFRAIVLKYGGEKSFAKLHEDLNDER